MDTYIFRYKNNVVRADHLRHWTKNGGVMILGYEMFRSLVNGKKLKEKTTKQITASLLDPGMLIYFSFVMFGNKKMKLRKKRFCFWNSNVEFQK